MRSITPMRIAKIGQLVAAALLCVLGLVLILCPALSITLIGVFTGILLILFGVVKLIGYFSKDLFRLAFQYDLASGILLIALGALVLMSPANLLSLICIAIGIAVLADGLFKIQIALDARTFGLRTWWLILAAGVLAGLVGLLLLFRPVEGADVLTVLLGCALLADGILSFVTVVCAARIVRHQRPDVIDADFQVERKD